MSTRSTALRDRSKDIPARAPRSNEERARKAADDYEALHGIRPPSMEEVTIELPEYLVMLGHQTRECYDKLIRSDLDKHKHLPVDQRPFIRPTYCHDFGEKWSEERFYDEANILAHDEKGNLWIVNRGSTTVTPRGIEDLPERSNPSSSSALARKRSRGVVPLARANPIQQGLALTSIRVRTPSMFGLFAMHVFAGLLGAMTMPSMNALLSFTTRIPPLERGLFVMALGLLLGVKSRRSPRLAAGLALGGVAACVPAAIDAIRLALAKADPAANVSTEV